MHPALRACRVSSPTLAAASLLLASATSCHKPIAAPSALAPSSAIRRSIELPPDPPPPHRPYSNLFVFGDSYSDTGAGHLNSNGPTAVAVLAQRLGISFTWYGAPDMRHHGINFAVAAARTGESPGIRNDLGELLAVGMTNQVQNFAELVRNGTIRFDPDQTMFFLAGGLNDRNVAPDYTRTNLDRAIDTLYTLGARRFTVALLPVKIEQFDVPGTRNNPGIAQVPADEQARHPDLRIALSNWGPFFDQVLTNPTHYNLNDTTSPCAIPQPQPQPTDQSPNQAPSQPQTRARTPAHNSPQAITVCPNPADHFFFYEAHPSAATHRAVGDLLFEEALHLASTS